MYENENTGRVFWYYLDSSRLQNPERNIGDWMNGNISNLDEDTLHSANMKSLSPFSECPINVPFWQEYYNDSWRTNFNVKVKCVSNPIGIDAKIFISLAVPIVGGLLLFLYKRARAKTMSTNDPIIPTQTSVPISNSFELSTAERNFLTNHRNMHLDTHLPERPPSCERPPSFQPPPSFEPPPNYEQSSYQLQHPPSYDELINTPHA